MSGKDYKGLLVWQKTMDLVEEIYRATQTFPSNEIYGLTSQLRRAAVSIPSNIAEGQGRHSPGDFHRFLAIAHGSLCEVETQLVLSQRLGYLQPERAEELLGRAEEAGKLLGGLTRSVEAA